MANFLTLDSFLMAASERPFSWSSWDCLSWFGEWIAQSHGINPAVPFTRRYSTDRGALRLIRKHGGMAGVVDAAVTPLGIGRTDDPQPGDIAIVDAPEGEMGGIVTGVFVASLGYEGLRYRRLPILTAWRV